EDLLQKIILPADILAAMKVNVHGPSADVEGHTYDMDLLTQAQSEAVNGRPASVLDRTGRQKLYLYPDPTAAGVGLKLQVGNATETKNWRDPVFPVLLDDVGARIAFLE